jgi:hypothetical protein
MICGGEGCRVGTHSYVATQHGPTNRNCRNNVETYTIQMLEDQVDASGGVQYYVLQGCNCCYIGKMGLVQETN